VRPIVVDGVERGRHLLPGWFIPCEDVNQLPEADVHRRKELLQLAETAIA
jgi:hypothetical protein